MFRWKWLGLVICSFLVMHTVAQSAEKEFGFINRVFKGPDGEAKFVVFLPHDYDPKGSKEYPVILFLHGMGESGADGINQTKVGIGQAIKKKAKTFHFIVIFPQSQKRNWKADSADGKRALAILDEVLKTYKTDPKRIYLTGLSMGGFGTWSMANAFPERWAAIAPVCGGVYPKEKIESIAAKIKDIPCWCFHGDADKAVPVKFSQGMIAALKTAGAAPRYDEYAGVGHNSWDRAYGTAELYDWFLQHKSK